MILLYGWVFLASVVLRNDATVLRNTYRCVELVAITSPDMWAGLFVAATVVVSAIGTIVLVLCLALERPRPIALLVLLIVEPCLAAALLGIARYYPLAFTNCVALFVGYLSLNIVAASYELTVKSLWYRDGLAFFIASAIGSLVAFLMLAMAYGV